MPTLVSSLILLSVVLWTPEDITMLRDTTDSTKSQLDLSEYIRVGGIATYYNPGLMDSALRNHGVTLCPSCLGSIALLTDTLLGTEVYLQRVGHDPEGPYMVGDCGGDGLPFENWLLDVDYKTKARWNMNAPIYITLWIKKTDKGDQK